MRIHQSNCGQVSTRAIQTGPKVVLFRGKHNPSVEGGFWLIFGAPPFHRHPSLQEKNRKRLGGRRDTGFSAKCLPIDFCHWLLLCRRVANVQTWPLSAAYSHAISFDNLLNFVWQFESNSDQLTYLNQLTQFKYLSRYLKLSKVYLEAYLTKYAT